MPSFALFFSFDETGGFAHCDLAYSQDGDKSLIGKSAFYMLQRFCSGSGASRFPFHVFPSWPLFTNFVANFPALDDLSLLFLIPSA